MQVIVFYWLIDLTATRMAGTKPLVKEYTCVKTYSTRGGHYWRRKKITDKNKTKRSWRQLIYALKNYLYTGDRRKTAITIYFDCQRRCQCLSSLFTGASYMVACCAVDVIMAYESSRIVVAIWENKTTVIERACYESFRIINEMSSRAWFKRDLFRLSRDGSSPWRFSLQFLEIGARQ